MVQETKKPGNTKKDNKDNKMIFNNVNVKTNKSWKWDSDYGLFSSSDEEQDDDKGSETKELVPFNDFMEQEGEHQEVEKEEKTARPPGGIRAKFPIYVKPNNITPRNQLTALKTQVNSIKLTQCLNVQYPNQSSHSNIWPIEQPPTTEVPRKVWNYL